MSILLTIFSLILVILCLFIGLIVLMQRASSNAGMGSALGGGAAESAFGGETANVLTRITIWSIVIFFVLSMGLYMGFLHQATRAEASDAPSLSAVVQQAIADAPSPKAAQAPAAPAKPAAAASTPQTQAIPGASAAQQ